MRQSLSRVLTVAAFCLIGWVLVSAAVVGMCVIMRCTTAPRIDPRKKSVVGVVKANRRPHGIRRQSAVHRRRDAFKRGHMMVREWMSIVSNRTYRTKQSGGGQEQNRKSFVTSSGTVNARGYPAREQYIFCVFRNVW